MFTAVNFALLWPARRDLPWRPVAPLLAGSVAGVPVGVLFLAGADPRLARGALGAVLVAASAACPSLTRAKAGSMTPRKKISSAKGASTTAEQTS